MFQFGLWFGLHVLVAVGCVEAGLSVKNMPSFLDSAVVCTGCCLNDDGVVSVVIGLHVPPTQCRLAPDHAPVPEAHEASVSRMFSF